MGGAAGRGVPSARPADMGGSESSHGGRTVSFGLDEREQVRVLQGIRVRRPEGGRRRPREGGCGAEGQGPALGRALLERGRGNVLQGWKGSVRDSSKEKGRGNWQAARVGAWRSRGVLESGGKRH